MDLRVLTSGGMAILVASLAGAGRTASEPVELTRVGTRVDVHIGGHPFATYHFDPSVAKPYFYPLRSAHGASVTRGYPMTTEIAGDDRDEPHQRGMYFAHGDINGFDFWGEAAFPAWSDHGASTFGRTVFRRLDEIQNGDDAGILQLRFDLMTPSGIIGEETQRYRFSGDERSRMIDCAFAIQATHGPITMRDTKEGTFAIRVAKGLHPPTGRMVNADGASGEKGLWGKRSNWVDYSGRVGDNGVGNGVGEEVGVAVFDHPQNRRTPAYWHARAYGLLAANPFGVRQFTGDRRQDGRYTIPAGESLALRYGVLIHRGNASQADVADAYRQFAAQQ
jgi:methane monooxygenase PmoA-like